MDNVKKFIETTEKAEKIIESGVPWRVKYDLIFSEDISDKIHETGIDFDHYDPDMDYIDDVMAYFQAINNKTKELKQL